VRQFTPWQPQPCGPYGMGRWTFVAVIASVLATAQCVLAQPPMPGGGHGGAGAPKKKVLPSKPVPGAKTGAPKSKEAAMPADMSPDKLPAGYEPPLPAHELMLLDLPLMSAEELTANRKLIGKYAQKLRRGEYQTKEDKELIDKGLRYRLYVMTTKDQERDLHKRREELTQQDLRNAGGLIAKADQQLTFRKYVLGEVLKLVEPMLDNSFYVRIQAVTLLGELELVPADPTKNIKVETYTPACELLLKVLDSPDQPPAVKIAAARSLVRLCKFSGVNLPPVEMRHRIAKSALAELAKTDTHYWYQMRLIEVLSALDVAFDLQTKKPFIVTAMQSILNDPQRDWHARAEAAWALGRVPFDSSVDVPGVIRDVMQFTHDLAKAAQQSPSEPRWKTCLFKVYLAFQPLNTDDREATRRTRGGLLNSPLSAAQTQAQQVYPLIVPIVNTVLNDKPIVAKMISDIDAWLQKAKPTTTQANANPNGVGQLGP
jgi:hypothetical protein